MFVVQQGNLKFNSNAQNIINQKMKAPNSSTNRNSGIKQKTSCNKLSKQTSKYYRINNKIQMAFRLFSARLFPFLELHIS